MKDLQTKLNWLSRERKKQLLGSIGAAVYDHEPEADVDAAILDSIRVGDLSVDDLEEDQ